MSTKLNNLTEAYRLFLSSLRVTTTSDDLLIQDIDDIQTQIMVDSKPVALPTDNIVNNYTDGIVVFHPLCENLLLGESPVLQETRNLVMEFLNDYALKLIDSILSIAIDETLVSELTPKQLDFIRCAAGADSTSLKNWRAVMRRADTRGSSNRVLTIYLKRGAMLGGSKHKRVANVTFNLLSTIDDGELTLFGAKIRKSDAKLYSKIIRTIFGNVDEEDGYSASSDSLTAPYFESLIRAYHNVLKDMNAVSWNLRKPIEQSTGRKLHVNDEFMDELKDIREYRDVLPTMPLNDGDRNSRREDEVNAQQPQQQQQHVENTTDAVNKLAAQGSPFYNQNVSVDTQPQQQQMPVQQPQFNAPQPPVQNNPFTTPPQQGSQFPSLQEQLAGVPLGGYVAPAQGAFPSYMNPYQQPQQQQFNPQMNPYAQQMMMQNPNPNMPQQWQQQPQQWPQQQNWQQPQQAWGQQQPQPYGFGQPSPFGFPR